MIEFMTYQEKELYNKVQELQKLLDESIEVAKAYQLLARKYKDNWDVSNKLANEAHEIADRAIHNIIKHIGK